MMILFKLFSYLHGKDLRRQTILVASGKKGEKGNAFLMLIGFHPITTTKDKICKAMLIRKLLIFSVIIAREMLKIESVEKAKYITLLLEAAEREVCTF